MIESLRWSLWLGKAKWCFKIQLSLLVCQEEGNYTDSERDRDRQTDRERGYWERQRQRHSKRKLKSCTQWVPSLGVYIEHGYVNVSLCLLVGLCLIMRFPALWRGNPRQRASPWIPETDCKWHYTGFSSWPWLFEIVSTVCVGEELCGLLNPVSAGKLTKNTFLLTA